MAKVHKYKFLDTHLRLDNENAFHALALDEHRKNFEPTFWTRTVRTGQSGPPDRPLDHVEQRWFVGAHANVGGGYASDPLAQRPLKWLMDKAAGLGLVFRDQVVIDTGQVTPPIANSYREFARGFYRFISRPFYRPVGPPPDQGTQATTARINETIDGSVFERWRADKTYRSIETWVTKGEEEMNRQIQPPKQYSLVERQPAASFEVERLHRKQRLAATFRIFSR